MTRPPPLEEDGALEGALGPLTEGELADPEEPVDCEEDDPEVPLEGEVEDGS